MFACSKRLVAFFVLAIGMTGATAAELGLELGVESFRWREFDAGGGRLLEESGPRYRLDLTWHRAFGADSLNSLLLRGGLYLGRVDYDGQACNLSSGVCFPFRTETDYVGVLTEGRLARHIGATGNGEVFAGGGIDTWERDVKGRGGVGDAIETWTVFYLLAGGGARWGHAATRYRAQAGLKIPFYTYETAIYDLELEPKGRFSFFARLGADFVSAGRPQWGFGVYYDSYRFARSDVDFAVVPGVGERGFVQPESHQDVIGFYGVVYLDN